MILHPSNKSSIVHTMHESAGALSFAIQADSTELQADEP